MQSAHTPWEHTWKWAGTEAVRPASDRAASSASDMFSAYSLSFELFESLSLFFPSPWNCVSDTAIIGGLIFRRQVEEFSTWQFEYKPFFFTQFSLHYACPFGILTTYRMIPPPRYLSDMSILLYILHLLLSAILGQIYYSHNYIHYSVARLYTFRSISSYIPFFSKRFTYFSFAL